MSFSEQLVEEKDYCDPEWYKIDTKEDFVAYEAGKAREEMEQRCARCGKPEFFDWCYSCENTVHERCVCEMRHALSSWADAVRLHEHYGGGSGGGGHLVCPQCYNDYHEKARVSTHCDRGYLSRQGVETIWE